MEKKYKLIIGFSAVGMVIIIAALAYVMLTVLNLKQTSQGQTEKVSTNSKKKNNVEIFELEDAITVNIQDEKGTQHIVRVVVAFGINKNDKGYKNFSENFESKTIVIRDEIIQVVREQTYEMMIRSDSQQKLKDEILQRVNKLLNTQIIKEIYFGDFFVQ